MVIFEAWKGQGEHHVSSVTFSNPRKRPLLHSRSVKHSKWHTWNSFEQMASTIRHICARLITKYLLIIIILLMGSSFVNTRCFVEDCFVQESCKRVMSFK